MGRSAEKFKVEQKWREKRNEGEGDLKGGGEKGRKLIFWNVAGIRDKDRDVWEFLEDGDFISLTETWMEEKQGEFLMKRLSSKWEWRLVPASREKREAGPRGVF